MNKYAILRVYYNSLIFESIPFPLEDDNEYTILISKILEYGPDFLDVLKFPTGETSTVLLSKTQLMNSVIEIDVYEEKKKSKITKDELLKS